MESNEQREFLIAPTDLADKSNVDQQGPIGLVADFPSSMSTDSTSTYPQVYGYVTLPPDVTADNITFLPTTYQLGGDTDDGTPGFLLPGGQMLVTESEHDRNRLFKLAQSCDSAEPSDKLEANRQVMHSDVGTESANPVSADLQPLKHDEASETTQFVEGDFLQSFGTDADSNEHSKNPQQVFACLSARLSAAVLSAIPGSQVAFLQHTADNCELSLRRDHDTNFILDGNLSGIMHAHRQLSRLLSQPPQENHLQTPIDDEFNKTPVTCKDKATSCCLLQPQYSRSGRPLKWRTIELDDSDINGDDEPPAESATVRRRRGRPRRVAETAPGTTAAAVKQPLDIMKIAASVIVKADDDAQWGSGDTVTEEPIEERDREKGVIATGDAAGVVLTNEKCQDSISCEQQAEADVLTATDSGIRLGRPKPDKDYEQMMPFRYFCDHCSFRTKRRTHLQRHVAVHTRSTLLRCNRCPFTTVQASHLRRHLVTHATSVLSCSRCQYRTDSRALMTRHMRGKHASGTSPNPPAKILQCAQCDYRTDRPHRFTRHARCHAPPPGLDAPDPEGCYQCEQCTYRTTRKEHYARHVADVHSQHRPFLCDHCGRRFKRQDALKQHRMLHQANRSRPYACSVCHKTFRSQAHLSEHATRHSDVRAFLCEICGASFKTKSVQQKHIRTIHANPRAFACTHCAKRFNTKFALQRHTNMHDAPPASQKRQAFVVPPSSNNVQIILEEQVIADLQLVADDRPAVTALQHPSVAMDTAAIVYGEDQDTAVVDLPAAYTQSGDGNEATTALLYLTNFQSL